MLRRPFGNSGLQVPALAFGAMQIGDPQLAESHVGRLLNHVLDAGLTLIDTARSYGMAEERIGRHLARRRDEFVLSTKVGYGVAGVPDWSYECILRGVDDARSRLQTDVIDIVHLHSCGRAILEAGEVTNALERCRADGKIRVAAYSGDDAPLQYALASGQFGAIQASVSVCDQQSLTLLQQAQTPAIGTIAKRSLAGRPWAGTFSGDFVHDEYRRRFATLRESLAITPANWDEFALRFAAFAPGVDSVIVGGIDAANVDRNVAAVRKGALEAEHTTALQKVYEAHAGEWPGLV